MNDDKRVLLNTFFSLEFASPRRKITGSANFRSSSSSVLRSLASSAIYWESWPAVGRYIAMWMLTLEFGSSRMIGRKEEVSVMCVEMKGSKELFHMTRVPPFAFDDIKGSSGSCRSSKFNEAQYSPLKYSIWFNNSH